MGIGVARKVKIVVVGQTDGIDGPDVTAEEVANLWAQINTITQTRGFDAGKANYKTSYEFLIRYDSAVSITIRCMIEYSNRFYSIQSIERVDRVRAENKFASQVLNNPEGKYWRIVATSQDIA
jgi:SPP1 family predicted phage head-tail adaptor